MEPDIIRIINARKVEKCYNLIFIRGKRMTLLIIGLMLWAIVHLFPATMPAQRALLIERLGNGYQGLFALLILSSVVLIVFGWKAAIPINIYQPIGTLTIIAKLVIFLAFVLMAAANFPATRIKKFIRHPQLTGVLCWSIAHLMLNGDSRSVILFTSMAVWSVISMLMINKRDGNWEKPTIFMPMFKELIIPALALIMVAIMVYFHAYLSGIALIH